MPPLAGPRLTLCWMRNPVKTSTWPSSMVTGRLTVSSRWGTRSTRRRPGSRSSCSAALSNCVWATAQMFGASATGFELAMSAGLEPPVGRGPAPPLTLDAGAGRSAGGPIIGSGQADASLPKVTPGAGRLVPRCERLDHLHGQRDRSPAAEAERGEGSPAAATPQLIEEGGQHACAGCPDRVAEGDGAAIDIDPIPIKAERVAVGQHL